MCWTTQTPPVKHIAKEIIYVYKVVFNIDEFQCRSLIMRFDYIYKQECVEPSLEIKECKYAYRGEVREIYKGFHSYAYLNKATKKYNTLSSKHYNVALVECIIPKGSTFYRNEFDEIVSNRIIINRILKPNAKLPCSWGIIYLFIIILLSCFILFELFIS